MDKINAFRLRNRLIGLENGLKRILVTELKDWSPIYTGDIISVLNTLALQIKKVNFFESDYGMPVFFDFLTEFIKSNPRDT